MHNVQKAKAQVEDETHGSRLSVSVCKEEIQDLIEKTQKLTLKSIANMMAISIYSLTQF